MYYHNDFTRETSLELLSHVTNQPPSFYCASPQVKTQSDFLFLLLSYPPLLIICNGSGNCHIFSQTWNVFWSAAAGVKAGSEERRKQKVRYVLYVCVYIHAYMHICIYILMVCMYFHTGIHHNITKIVLLSFIKHFYIITTNLTTVNKYMYLFA